MELDRESLSTNCTPGWASFTVMYGWMTARIYRRTLRIGGIYAQPILRFRIGNRGPSDIAAHRYLRPTDDFGYIYNKFGPADLL